MFIYLSYSSLTVVCLMKKKTKKHFAEFALKFVKSEFYSNNSYTSKLQNSNLQCINKPTQITIYADR